MFLEELFKGAAKSNASDVHIVAGQPPTYRIDGELKPVSKTSVLSDKEAGDLIKSILTREQEERFAKERELDFAYQLGDIRFRINVHYSKGALGLAARFIPMDIPSMDDLILPETVQNFISFPHGLVLVTGPTGSGKSTTLAAMIEAINQNSAENIITLEDPIEFLFKQNKSLIRQRELGSDMTSFADGLKYVLRQDPDVIMVGEMRDLETISSALTLAETGHLVFATLHTWSAAQTIERIIDVFPQNQQSQIRLQLALTLRGVVSQQLLPKKGGGRVAAREILIVTLAVANLIRENKIPQMNTVIQTGAKLGMVSLAQDLKRLIKEGLITKEDAMSYVIGASAIELEM